MARSKPAPNLFLRAAVCMRKTSAECIVVEVSPVGVAAGVAANMTVIGFTDGSHAGTRLGAYLRAAGSHLVTTDMRALKRVIDLRGW